MGTIFPSLNYVQAVCSKEYSMNSFSVDLTGNGIYSQESAEVSWSSEE